MRFKQVPLRCEQKYRLYPHENLVNAYNAVKIEGVSVCRASLQYGVPEQTLRDRVCGHIGVNYVTTGRSPVLSLEEEEKIYQHIKAVAELGYGYTREEVTSLATDYAFHLGKRTFDNPLTINWFRAYINRWPKIIVRKPRTLEYSRAKGASAYAVNKYFGELETILVKYDLQDKPHLIYNIDEKGFMQNHKPPQVVATDDFHPQAVTGSKSAITTVIGAGSASGVAVPPFFIFAGARMLPDLLKDGTPGVDGTVSATGWSNTNIFRQYMKEHFFKFIPARQPGQHLLVLFDGHLSHTAIDIIEWAEANNIILFVLPAHTSHLLQPLDVACYGPLESIYDRIAHKFTRSSHAFVTRYDMCNIVCRAYSKALTPENLYAGFRRSGICPFDSTVIKPESVAPATVFNAEDASQNIHTDDPVEKLGDADCGEPEPVPEVTSDNVVTVNKAHNIEQNMHADDEILQTGVGDNCANSGEGSDSPSSFMSKKFDKLKAVKSAEMKKRKPRKSLGKITSGKAITERDVMEKIVAYNADKGPKPEKKQKGKKAKPANNEKGKHATTTTCNTPQPGPSHFYVSDSESYNSSDAEISETEKCCVCKLFTPTEIRQSNCIQFTQWVQCDYCTHWVHLKFCTPERVVRRGVKFSCIHCKVQEE